MTPARQEALACLTAMAVAVAWTVGLCGPGLFHDAALPAGAFHASHAFFARHLATVPMGGALLHPPLGWPEQPAVALIGGVPLGVAALAQGLGPLRAYSLALLVGPLLTVGATFGWLGRVSDGGPAARALGALSVATCAFAVAALGNGQLAKVQLWVVPAVLWALAVFRDAPSVRGGSVLLLSAGVAVATAPSLAVQLPIAAGVQLLARTPSVAQWKVRPLAPALGGLGIVALGLLPGVGFLGAGADAGTRPAVAGTGTRVGGAAPSASLDDLFLGLGARADGLDAVNHAPVLAGAVVVVAVVLGVRSGAARALGLGLLGVGAVLALGPELRVGGDAVAPAGWTLHLPAAGLAALGYPMGRTGQWYRFVVVAGLGLAVLVARATSWRATVAVAGAVALGAVQAVVQSGHAFPRPAVEVPAHASMVALGASTVPGAVVVLPLVASTVDGGPGLAMAALSGRATSAMARHSQDHPATTTLRALLQRAHATHTPEVARRVLAEAGVAVVVWRPGATVMRGEVWLDPEAVAADLGPPVLDGATALWWTDGQP